MKECYIDSRIFGGIREDGTEITGWLSSRSSSAEEYRSDLVIFKNLISFKELSEKTGWSKEENSTKESAGRIFSVEYNGEKFYPAFLSTSFVSISLLEELIENLKNLDNWNKTQFFFLPKLQLDGLNPLQALTKGMFKQVKLTAEIYIRCFDY